MAHLAVFPKGFFDDLVSGKMSLHAWLDMAAMLDVDGVELYPRFFQTFDLSYVHGVARRLEQLGLKMPMLCHSPDFTQPDQKLRDLEVEKTKEMMRLTAHLGGKFCRVLTGQARPGLDENEAHQWVIQCLERLLPEAETLGIILTIENHYKDGTWLYPEFAMSKDRFVAILNELDSPWLRVQYDPSNAIVAGDDPYELLGMVVDRVATMHASDRYLQGGTLEDLRTFEADPHHGYAKVLKHGVIGEGFNDFDRIFSMLAKAGFDGWISIEDGEGPTVEEGMDNLRRSVDFLRRKMADHFQAT